MFPARPTRREPRKIRQGLPNLLTTLALCSAMAALHFAIKEDWDRALAAVAISAIFDALDGRAARLLNASSRFGAQLDSLSDFLAFGVAPGVMLLRWLLKDAKTFGLAAVMTFVLCSAMRLARFTAMAERKPPGAAPSKFFVGMPTPGAACVVLIPLMLAQSSLVAYQLPKWIVVAHTFLIAWLMISRQPMFSFKGMHIPGRFKPLLLICVGLVVVMATADAWLTGAILAGAYLLTLPVSVWLARKEKALEPAAHAPDDESLSLAGTPDVEASLSPPARPASFPALRKDAAS